jgi:hypothetical protein
MVVRMTTERALQHLPRLANLLSFWKPIQNDSVYLILITSKFDKHFVLYYIVKFHRIILSFW